MNHVCGPPPGGPLSSLGYSDMTARPVENLTLVDLLLPASLLVGLSIFSLMQLDILSFKPTQVYSGPPDHSGRTTGL